jgi:adenylate cyclase class 2
MPTEIEAKFLHADHDVLRTRLKELGATCTHPNRLTKRLTLDFPDKRLRHTAKGWIRIRDEGDKITLTYKQLNDRSLHGMQEVELVVDDFDKAEAFLRTLGVEAYNFQETKRESWTLDDVEIDLDEWPWIDPFAEVEGPDEAAVWSVVERLGLDRSKAVFGSVEIAYQDEYGVTEEEVDDWKEITFSDTPEWLRAKAKR